MINSHEIVKNAEKIKQIADSYGYENVKICPPYMEMLKKHLVLILSYKQSSKATPYSEAAFKAEIEELIGVPITVHTDEGILENIEDKLVKSKIKPASEQAIPIDLVLEDVPLEQQWSKSNELSQSSQQTFFAASSSKRPLPLENIDIQFDKHQRMAHISIPFSRLKISEYDVENESTKDTLQEYINSAVESFSQNFPVKRK